MITFAQTTGTHSTTSGAWTAIPGLQVKLPQGVGEAALVILNVPNPFATGNDFPGGNFGLQVNGKVIDVVATFTYNEKIPPSSGRVPTTLCAAVPLSQTGASVVQAVWSGVRGSAVNIDSPATLTAIID